MKEIFIQIRGILNRFSWRGFLFRRTLRSKIAYAIDFLICVMFRFLFFLTVTASIAGVIMLIILIIT